MPRLSDALSHRLGAAINTAFTHPAPSNIAAVVNLSAGLAPDEALARVGYRYTRQLRNANSPEQRLLLSSVFDQIKEALTRNALHRQDWFYGYSDGSSKRCGTPVPDSGVGGVIYDPDKHPIHAFSEYRKGLTSYESELTALLLLLEEALSLGVMRLYAHVDCRSLADMIEHKPYDERILPLTERLSDFCAVRLIVIPRKNNRVADRLAHKACSSGGVGLNQKPTGAWLAKAGAAQVADAAV